MQALFYEVESGNFGDDLNRFLWDDLLPGYKDVAPDVWLLGVGTLFSSKRVPEGRILAVGSGAGYGDPPDVRDSGKWDIRAVRGPKTAKMLGLPPDRAVADAAILLPRLARFAYIDRTDDVVFVPHWQTLPGFDWEGAARRGGVTYQNPGDDCEMVVRRIAGARAVIAESMHAAIIADAFGVPWIPVRIGNRFNHFKWADWAASLDIAFPEPLRFFRGTRIVGNLHRRLHRAMPRIVPEAQPISTERGGTALVHQAGRDMARAAKGPFHLSNRARLTEQQDRYDRILAEIRRDYGLG